jgi:dTDP-glucose 4,6-dehydratase
MILVTGGAGFIGANFVLQWLAEEGEPIVNIDKLTYAGNLANLSSIQEDPRHLFVKGDICDRPLVESLLAMHQPRAIVHFAAESHVDRSIHGPEDFITTNIVGTFRLLDAARHYWDGLQAKGKESFRFLHVSTDEVYGSLTEDAAAFSETKPYAPNSPYSASKAASDHLVRAYHYTYGLPTIITNSSNNYGPYQFPEKLIPLMIFNAVKGKSLPVYGDGQHVRDWLYVGDHCAGIRAALSKGAPGETYNIGACNEKTNLEVVNTLCDLLDAIEPKKDGASYRTQVIFVEDRPGHDRRYAIDASKAKTELLWAPGETFETGLRKTFDWYLEHPDWVRHVVSGSYPQWIKKNYASRAAS